MNLPINQSTGYSGLVVSLNPSSFSGTLTFEVSGDNGLTYTVRQGYASTDNSTGVTTSTASAVSSLQFNVSGWTRFRVRASAYSSGSVVVTITPSPASASAGHGGGGTGAVSSVTGAGTVSCSPTTGSVVCTGSGGASAGAATAVQSSDGVGGFVDNGCTATGGAIVCANGVSGGPAAHLATYGACNSTTTAYKFAGIDDGSTNVIGATVSGGGSIAESVFCNTTAWTCAAGCTTTSGLADPGANGIVYRTALNTTSPATADSIGSMVYASGGGNANAQTVTLSPVPTALVVGMGIRWNPSNSNTGAATLNLNGLNITGGAPLVKNNSTALIANDLVVNNIAVAIWDGTNWELQNPQTAVSSVAATSPVVSSGGATPTISISGVTALQGNGTKLQLASGTTTTGHFPSYDVNGNLIDSTQPGGSGSPTPSVLKLEENFCSGLATSGNVGSMGWGYNTIGSNPLLAYPSATFPYLCGITFKTAIAATAGQGGDLSPMNLAVGTFGDLASNPNWSTTFIFRLPLTLAQTVFYYEVTNAHSTVRNPTGAYIRFDPISSLASAANTSIVCTTTVCTVTVASTTLLANQSITLAGVTCPTRTLNGVVVSTGTNGTTTYTFNASGAAETCGTPGTSTSAAETTFKVCNHHTTPTLYTCQDTAVTVDSAWHKIVIASTVAGTVVFTLDAQSPITLSSNFVAAAYQIDMVLTTLNTSQEEADVNYFNFYMTGLTR